MIKHYYSAYANTIQKGILGDLEEDFLKNLENNNRILLDKNNLIQNPVTYTFNSHGFRADEFDEKKQIVFLGDSYTLGMGVPNQNCWTTLVSKKLNLKNHNLGIAGSSHNTAFRLFYHYLDILEPKIVVFLTTETTRLEIIDDGIPISLGVNWQQENIISGNFYKKWINCDENSELNYQKNALAIENLCKKNSIDYFQFNRIDNFPYPLKDLSRDLNHPGIISHEKFASVVLNVISEKLGN